MKKFLFLFLAMICYVQVQSQAQVVVNPGTLLVMADTYAGFDQSMNDWVKAASGPEGIRRGKIVAGLNQVMAAHKFHDGGTVFTQFQRYLKKPYKPNLRDIYYVLINASQVAVTPKDVAQICSAAGIPPIAADALDLVVGGLLDKIDNGNLSELDKALFSAEVRWLTSSNAKVTITDFLQKIESDPEQDCDSILQNLDPQGVAVLESVVVEAVPTWTPPVLGYASFDKNLSAWINYKYTDAASKAVAQKEVVGQILELMHRHFEGQQPFPVFQQELLKTEPVWGGPLVYFTLSVDSTDSSDNLPVPTDAVEAIYRCAGLNIFDAQPNIIDRIYTELLSHQNGGTAGSQLSDSDVATYEQVIDYISTHQGKTVADVEAYINSITGTLSDYAQQDIQAIVDPLHYPRPYNYGEDTEYFRNDQKLLPLHPEDAQYYREHVIPSMGVGRYMGSDSVGRYRYVSGKGGEIYMTVHYNQFARVNQLAAAAGKSGGLTADDVAAWIKLYTDPASHFYDPMFYREIEDVAQISGVATMDLLNLGTLAPAKQTQVLAQVTDVFLTIAANPPPPIP